MRFLGWITLAVVLMLARTDRSQAQDTFLLGGFGEAKTQTLVFDGQAELEQVYYRGVGYRGYVGGYRGYVGYRPLYRPYIRPYYASYYRPYVYGGFYRPYAYASYYAPNYYDSGYYSPSYYTPNYGCYNPIAANPSNLPSATMLGSSSYVQGPIFQTSPSYRLPPPNGDGTYNYDGGPGQSMSLPGMDGPIPTFEQKRPTVPYEGKLVSIPAQQPKYSYPAFGDKTPMAVPAPAVTTSLRAISTMVTKAAVQAAYPAYGDR